MKYIFETNEQVIAALHPVLKEKLIVANCLTQAVEAIVKIKNELNNTDSSSFIVDSSNYVLPTITAFESKDLGIKKSVIED